MSAVWPQLVERLLVLLPTLPGWDGVAVYDGPPLAGDAPDSATDASNSYCAVGYVEDEQGAGSGQEQPSGDGFFDVETGEVRSELYTGNGDGDLSACRAQGWALFNALKDYMRTHRDLEALPQGTTTSLSFDVVTGKSEGAGQLLVLSVAYQSPIT